MLGPVPCLAMLTDRPCCAGPIATPTCSIQFFARTPSISSFWYHSKNSSFTLIPILILVTLQIHFSTHIFITFTVILCLCCNIQLHMTIQVQLLSHKRQFNVVGTRQSYSISLACLFFSPFSLILFIILLWSPSFYFAFSFRYRSKHIVALRALCFNFWAWNWILGF